VSSSRKNIVIIGGGNGTSVLISSLKHDFDTRAIVSMADDGGSTGRLRKELGTSAVGDIRQCLVALTDSEASKKLFSYRYGSGELKGHSFGNIFLTTIENSTGSLYKAIDRAMDILEVNNGKVMPVTDSKLNLVMNYKGQKTEGVYKIANTKVDGKNADFKLNPSDAALSDRAKRCIEKADLIIIAPGNFYCSIIPALIVKGMGDALSKSSAKKVLVANLANFKNHTAGYTVGDYLAEISRVTNNNLIDIVLANDNLNLGTGDEAVDITGRIPVEMIKDNLVSDDKLKPDPNDKIANLRSSVSHDKNKLNKLITQILRS
jgi:uncharacterized cofD-like protein